ncbi:MAG: (2Fe-2S) ferredoxin domain-containing protein [Bacillota bacterium]
MKSLEELNELKEKARREMKTRDNEKKPTLIVGMGTCGIAAGARDILQAVLKEIEKRNLDVRVTQTGCIGMCEKEPLLDVKIPGEDRITYGNLKPEDVNNIIVEHVINGNIVQELAVARMEDQ